MLNHRSLHLGDYRATIVWIVLALLTLLVFTHTSQAASNESITIEYWSWATNAVPQEILEPFVEEFMTQHPNIKVEFSPRSTSPAQLLPAIAAGVGPDVVRVSESWIAEYGINNVLSDLTPWLNRDNVSIDEDIAPGLLRGWRWNGKLIGIPNDTQFLVMFGNRNVLAQTGISEPEPGWVWKDFRETMQRIVRVDAQGELERTGAAGIPRHFSEMWLFSAGASVFDDLSSLEVRFNTPEARSAFSELRELADLNLIRTDWNRVTAIHEDRAGFAVDLSIRTNTHREVMPPDSHFIAPLLVGPTGAQRTYGVSTGIGLVATGRSAERQAAAWELVKFLNSTEAHAAYNSSLYRIPPRRSALQHSDYYWILQSDPVIAQVVERILPYATTQQIFLPGPAQSTFQGLVGEYLTDGSLSLNALVEQLDDQVNAALRDLK